MNELEKIAEDMKKRLTERANESQRFATSLNPDAQKHIDEETAEAEAINKRLNICPECAELFVLTNRSYIAEMIVLHKLNVLIKQEKEQGENK